MTIHTGKPIADVIWARVPKPQRSYCSQLRPRGVGDVGVRARSSDHRHSSAPSFGHLPDAMLSSDGRLHL